jgi:hypothetical protein
MSNEKDRMKHKMIKIMEAKINSQSEPSLEMNKEESITYHWLSELWQLAFVSGEVAGIKSCKNLLGSSINELEEIENFAEKNIKKTLQ